MDVHLCHRFLCLSNPESRSAFAATVVTASTLLVTTAAYLKSFGQVHTDTVVDGVCYMFKHNGWNMPELFKIMFLHEC